MYQTIFPCYFASANTANGFISKFENIFDPEKLNQIYILKGGPGTGKSSLMKSIENVAKDLGLEVEDFLCSSDPDSLDGIIIKNKKIAILDGTTPHSFEPSFPGAVENIINTGSFWNSEQLSKNKTEIMNLIKEKKRYYNRAYRFLKAYGETEEELCRFYKKAILYEKMERNTDRVLKNIPSKQGAGKIEIRLDETVYEEGAIKLKTFEKLSDRIFILQQNEYVALEYLNMIYEKLRSGNHDLILSFSHKFPNKISSILLPNEKTSFIVGDKTKHETKLSTQLNCINMKRFYNHEEIQNEKQKIHFGKRCSQMLLNGAAESLGEAKKLHGNLEKIYISAMDFKKFNDERNQLIKEIFS